MPGVCPEKPESRLRTASGRSVRPGRRPYAHNGGVKPFRFLADARGIATARDGFVEKFRRMREELGISAIMVGEVDDLAPVVERLVGT